LTNDLDMYNYVFWVIYEGNISRNKSKVLSRWNASCIVFFTVLLHIFLVISVCKRFEIAPLNLEYLTNNTGIEGVFFLLLMIFFYFYYTESRIEKFREKYASRHWSGIINVIFIGSLIIIPLITIIILRWKG